jgi:hypothetical protein
MGYRTKNQQYDMWVCWTYTRNILQNGKVEGKYQWIWICSRIIYVSNYITHQSQPFTLYLNKL